jgi:hypothetical protein
MRNTVLAALAITALAAAGGSVAAGDAAGSAVEAACLAKLAETASRPKGDIRVVGTAPDGGGKVITLDLDGAENAWLCHVDAAGNIVDVMYQGEG